MTARNAVIVVAAGRGTRAAGIGETPKQYVPIGGKAVLTRSIEAFLGHDSIHHVQPVIYPGDGALYEAAVAATAVTQAACTRFGRAEPAAIGAGGP